MLLLASVTVQAQRGGLCPFLHLFALMAVRKQAHRFLSMRYASRSKKESICGIRKIRIKRALTRSRCWTSLSDQTPLSDCCVLLLDICPIKRLCPIAVHFYLQYAFLIGYLCLSVCSAFLSDSVCPFAMRFYRTSLSVVRLQSGFDRTSLSSVCCGLLVEHL